MDYGALFIVRKARKLPILSFSCEPPPFCSIQINHLNKLLKNVTFCFFREFQPIVSASNDSSLSSDQDTNQFLV